MEKLNLFVQLSTVSKSTPKKSEAFFNVRETFIEKEYNEDDPFCDYENEIGIPISDELAHALIPKVGQVFAIHINLDAGELPGEGANAEEFDEVLKRSEPQE